MRNPKVGQRVFILGFDRRGRHTIEPGTVEKGPGDERDRKVLVRRDRPGDGTAVVDRASAAVFATRSAASDDVVRKLRKRLREIVAELHEHSVPVSVDWHGEK